MLTVVAVGNMRCGFTGESSPNIFTASLTDAKGAVVSISAMVKNHPAYHNMKAS